MKLQRRSLTVFLLLLSAVPLLAQTAFQRTTLQSSTSPFCIPWVDSGAKPGVPWSASTTSGYVEVFPDSERQTVLGFGATAQEKAWNALSVCTPAGRDSVIRALFDTSGCNFTWFRLPLGCCDFDDNKAPYSLNDNAGDYAMANFSLARDTIKRIPFIKWAQAYKPNIRFFASPWAPPAWMHTTNAYNSGNMKSDSATLAAYALYLEKAVTGFKTYGINIEFITPQNEPTQTGSNYPQCSWTPALQATFYKDYLIPLFRKDNIAAKIILGVYCCGSYADWIKTFMSDSVIRSSVGLCSHSFQNYYWGDSVWKQYPGTPFFETESDYGGSQNWSTGVKQFQDLANFMNIGKAAVFTEWNMLNNQKYQSGWGWTQDIAVTIDSATAKVTYWPYYWAAKHFGYYVPIGAKGVKFVGTGVNSGLTSAAFKNPNGDIIFETVNSVSSAVPLIIKIGAMAYNVVVPATSFNTFRITGATAVQEVAEGNHAASLASSAYIHKSMLYLSLPGMAKIREADLTLTDLQGRTVWSARRCGNAVQGSQSVAIHTGQGKLRSGTYLLSIKVTSETGAVSKIEKKVMSVN